jgi:mannosyl-oligosaccharide alpha-1,2-mannosidase
LKTQADSSVILFIFQFETTIRYLAGMLSAYESNGRQDEILLEQSKMLGSKLAVAWQGNSAIPWNELDFAYDAAVPWEMSIAGAGSNVLEFYTLAKYSRNFTYQTLAEATLRKIATNACYNVLPSLLESITESYLTP